MEAETIQKNTVSLKNHKSKRNTAQRVFLLFAVFCISVVNTFAQDIILKKDGSEIEAQVLEITDQQIKYKDFDFQSGPTRNINISDVFMITYANGQKEVFNKQATSPTPQTSQALTPQREFYETSSSDLQREFERIGRDDNQMLLFFRKNDFTNYYNSFASACSMRRTGASLLGTGLGLTGGGIIFMAVGLAVYDYNEGYYPLAGMAYAGYGMLCVGEVFTIVSIPISAVAGGRKKAIKNNFAREQFGADITPTYQPTLDLGCTGGGFGVSLKF